MRFLGHPGSGLSPRNYPVLRHPPPTYSRGQQSWDPRFCTLLRCSAPEWAASTERNLGRSRGVWVCVRVCSAGAQRVGWKCQELPSSTLEESFPRVIQHLLRAKCTSTRNSSPREFLGGGVAAPHMLLQGGGGCRWPGCARPPGATAQDAVSWGASSRCGNSPGPPTTHPDGLGEELSTHRARASPGLDLAMCFSLW